MRHTVYYRVSDCHSAAGAITSVCIRAKDRLQELLRFAYGDSSAVNKIVRVASRELAATPTRAADALAAHNGSWSQAVVSKALAKLRGSYSPDRAAAIQAAREEAEAQAEALAAENNAAWETV